MKKDNKGFSLVELIVVIAIMAVLMVVVTPALLRYVEKSRLQKDNSAIAEIENAAKIACASEDINQEIGAVAAGATISFDTNHAMVLPSTDFPKFSAEMSIILGNIKLSSNTYTKSGATAPSLNVKVDANQTVQVTINGLVQ